MHKMIFVEGISGSGKSTTTQKITEYLERKGIRAKRIHFPSDYLRSYIREARAWENRDPILESYLFACNARHQYITEIALESEPTVFISDRSYLTACIYCPTERFNVQDILALNRENPQPDLLLLLDCPAQLALERIVQRAEKGGKPLSRFENLSDLTFFRERYRMLTGIFPKTRVIDSSKPFCEVWNDIESVILEGVLNDRL